METRYISSRQNNLVKKTASLSEKRFRDKEGVFAVEGFTVLFEALGKGIAPGYVFIRENSDGEKSEKIISLLENLGIGEYYSVAENVFEKMTTEKGSDGFLSVFPKSAVPQASSFSDSAKFIALERVQDPGNVGTVIRGALALGISAVFLISCADIFSQKTVRASMGCVFSMPVKIFSSADEMFLFCKENKIKTVAAALDTDSKDIRDISFEGKVCTVIGNEGKGLSDIAKKLSDEKSIIPISDAESLNAAMASVIFMWEMKRRK